MSIFVTSTNGYHISFVSSKKDSTSYTTDNVAKMLPNSYNILLELYSNHSLVEAICLGKNNDNTHY